MQFPYTAVREQAISCLVSSRAKWPRA